MNYGYRYYSPYLGRWLSKDPIGEYGGPNLYAFLRNSPVDQTDLLGLIPYVPPELPPSVPDDKILHDPELEMLKKLCAPEQSPQPKPKPKATPPLQTPLANPQTTPTGPPIVPPPGTPPNTPPGTPLGIPIGPGVTGMGAPTGPISPQTSGSPMGPLGPGLTPPAGSPAPGTGPLAPPPPPVSLPKPPPK